MLKGTLLWHLVPQLVKDDSLKMHLVAIYKLLAHFFVNLFTLRFVGFIFTNNRFQKAKETFSKGFPLCWDSLLASFTRFIFFFLTILFCLFVFGWVFRIIVFLKTHNLCSRLNFLILSHTFCSKIPCDFIIILIPIFFIESLQYFCACNVVECVMFRWGTYCMMFSLSTHVILYILFGFMLAYMDGRDWYLRQLWSHLCKLCSQFSIYNRFRSTQNYNLR